jgi:sugar phosphate isomerase/epimerase
MQIAVSTLAFMGMQAEDIVLLAQKSNWTIEFSSGMPYREDMEEFFIHAPVKRLAHNYFPAPKVPFVLNLASSNTEIRNQSIAHCINGLQISKQVGAPFFSAHAGFCVDPNPDELGRKLVLSKPINRKAHWTLFIDSLKIITTKAQELGVKFLIENNVLAAVNVHPDGSNPLLCCDADEMLLMLKEVNHPALGLLIDTAHIKVSAHTLKYNADEAIKKMVDKILCIHHSDNDGSFDTNDKLTVGYWFLPHMKDFKNIAHVLEVKKLNEEEVKQQLNILES